MPDTTIDLDELIQTLTDAIGWSREMLANQPHLMAEIDRLEVRMYETSDALMSELAVTTTIGHVNSGKPWTDFLDMRNAIGGFFTEHFNNRIKP